MSVEKITSDIKVNLKGIQRRAGVAIAQQVLRRMIIHSKGQLKPLVKRESGKVRVVVPKTKADPDGKKAQQINRETRAVEKALEDTLHPKILGALIRRGLS